MLKTIKERLSRLLPKGQFARGVSILVGGTAGAQLLMILVSPLLTRLYTPEDFGLLAVYTGLLSLFTVVSSLRYELAIPLPENDQEAAHVTLLSFFIVIAVTIISGILVIFAGNKITELLGTPQLANYFWLLPLGVFLIGTYQVFNYWAIRTKSFSTIARTKIRQSITTVLMQLIGFKLGGISLLFGQTIGQGAGSYILSKPALKQDEFKNWRWEDLWGSAKRYKQFPLYSTWGSFANTAGAQLPPLLFAALFSPTIAGFYILTHRVLGLPMRVIGSAIGNVFLSHAAVAHRENKLQILFEQTLTKLIILAIPIVIVFILEGSYIFTFIFGNEWQQSGYFAQWLSIWLGMVFIASPLSILYEILEKQSYGMLFQIIMLIIRITAIYIGYYTNSVIIAVIAFSIASALCWLAFLFWAARITGSKILFVLKQLILRFGQALLLTAPLIANKFFIKAEISNFISLSITMLFIATYYVFQIRKTRV